MRNKKGKHHITSTSTVLGIWLNLRLVFTCKVSVEAKF